jgi:hypothetical protein
MNENKNADYPIIESPEGVRERANITDEFRRNLTDKANRITKRRCATQIDDGDYKALKYKIYIRYGKARVVLSKFAGIAGGMLFAWGSTGDAVFAGKDLSLLALVVGPSLAVIGLFCGYSD